MDKAGHRSAIDDPAIEPWVELAIRLGILGLLLFWSFLLVRPFLTIAIWSVVLTLALYPLYERLVRWLGGRRRLAAALLTIVNLLIVVGPVAWLALGLIESIRTLVERSDVFDWALPLPPDSVKTWPIIGERVFQFWDLASTNLKDALAKVAPHLKPVGTTLLYIAAGAGTGALKFIVALIVAGFLFPPAPSLSEAVRTFLRRLSTRGEEFAELAAATVRAVSRGVIGISALQALLVGLGLIVAGVPATSLIASAVLILGIVQIGPTLVILPLVVWSWMTMEATTALLFTAYMIPVSLLDNVLRPLVMGRGLNTPVLVILIGVVGGTISYGITGLFLGPIVLTMIWELVVAWVRERKDPHNGVGRSVRRRAPHSD